LIDQKIIHSAGHNNANYLQTEQAIKSGTEHAIHLFNAMRGIPLMPYSTTILLAMYAFLYQADIMI